MKTSADEPVAGGRHWPIVAIAAAIIGAMMAAPTVFMWWRANRPPVADASLTTVDVAVVEVGGRFHSGAETGTWIDLSNSRVDDPWLQAQRDHLAELSTVALSLRNSQISSAALAVLDGMKSIGSVDLVGTKLTDADCELLASLPNVQALHIGRTGISASALKALAEMPMLQAVTIDRTQATALGTAALARCSKLRGLRLLDADLSSLAAVQSLPLLGLEVQNQYPDAAMLPALKQSTGLKNLTLYDTHYSDAELEELRQALGDCTVRQLHYSTAARSIDAAWLQAEP